MSRKARNWISRLAPWLLIGGLLLVGLSVYSHLSTNNNSVDAPALSALVNAEGTVVAGRETTVEHKKPDGSISHTEQYYELDLKPASGGKPLLLRLDHRLDKATLAQVVEAQVSVAYDPSNANMTYSVRKGGEDIVGYAEVVRLRQPASSPSWLDYAGLLGAGILLLLGVGGLISRRSDVSNQANHSASRHTSRYPNTSTTTDFSEATPSEIQLARDEAEAELGSLVSIQGRSLLVDTQISTTRYH